jgi:hypothetical protein
MKKLLFVLILLSHPVLAGAARAAEDPGQVTLPLAVYTEMLKRLGKEPRGAPAAYALGQSGLSVQVSARDGQYTAAVEVTLQVETFENEWTLVPVLPAGAALKRATANGRNVQLVQGPDGLSWATNRAGTATVQLSYGADARRVENGFLLALPVPAAAAATLDLVFPEVGVDLAVVPSADLRIVAGKGATRYTASLPATSSVLVSWRAPGLRPYVIGRADYAGRLEQDAVAWTASFQVELLGEDKVTLPLLATSVTLNELRVDDRPATVFEAEGRFATVVEGRGSHRVTVRFLTPVGGTGGPPQVRLPIPRVPVSHFELVLPGRKAVTVEPGANLIVSEAEDATRASFYAPMSDGVVFSWTDAIPENLRAPFRANAGLYHAVYAEEGVLHGRASVVYEITHGETSQIELEIPADTQVNRITAAGGLLQDWAVAEAAVEGRRKINIYLRVPVKGEYVLDIDYERLLGGGASDQPVGVPLLSALNVHRQRGMVALLAGQELTLKPVSEAGLTRVGENQLPAFVRNQISMTVAHTYKYIEPYPGLSVQPMAPERRQGKFNAQVDTLISLGDVTMKGSATVEIDVKSGSIMELELGLPPAVNVLGVSAPSLRSQQVREADGRQAIVLAFTREMEGQFRVEINYERITDADLSKAAVPTISVPGAEVEHGRIAVEALTPVEVRAVRSEQLSGLDVNELPQQLVLKTTNPILMAFRYVHAKPPFELALEITRHKEIDVQVAAIESAVYNTLFTRDGLAVTAARLMVRNSRRQFLRLALPEGSKVWSVFVDGNPEKPAEASAGGGAVLVKMINSAVGFPVEIVYATPVSPFGAYGEIGGSLPRPDVVVTHTRWNVFLPVDRTYGVPDSSMDAVVAGGRVNPRREGGELFSKAAEQQRAQQGQPLRLSVPTQGIYFAFEKLYADQSPKPAAFSVGYVSEGTGNLSLLASLAGVVLLWLGIVALGSRKRRLSRPLAVACLTAGLLLEVASLGFMGTSALPASALALAIAAALGLWWLAARGRAWWHGRRQAATAGSEV